MATYLRSDGKIDKQDKYKTRMSDYARKFSPFSITDDVSSEAESDLANIAFENMTDEDIVMAQAVKPSGITSGAATGVDPRMEAIAAAVMEAKKGDPKAKGYKAMQMALGIIEDNERVQDLIHTPSSKLNAPQERRNPMDRFSKGIAGLTDRIGNLFGMEK